MCCSTRTGRRARGVRYLDARLVRARGRRRPRDPRARARSRRPGCCCASGSATPTSSAATSCTTSRRSCSASSRSVCTRTAAARSRTSWTTRSSGDAESAAAARRGRCRGSAAASSSTAARASRSWRPCTSPPARSTPGLMLDSPMRDRMAVFTMQGEDLPQATQPHRPRPARHATCWGFPAGRVTYQPHRHEVAVRRALGAAARGGDARGRRRAHVLGDVAAAPGAARRLSPGRPDPDRRATSWARRAWATTRARACATGGSACTTSRTCSHRLVGVPDVAPATDRRSRSWRSRSARPARSPASIPCDRTA